MPCLQVEMSKSFRPGDIVIARVISLGDAQSYLLTTAENELGVVIATSEAGFILTYYYFFFIQELQEVEKNIM